MIAKIETQKGKQFKVDLKKPLDISIPLRASEDNVRAWYVNPPRIEPVMDENFTGSVAKGGSVNFNDIYFNPHGHGTHTECVGHISKEVHSVNQCLREFFFLAEVVSIQPVVLENGDEVITPEQLRGAIKEEDIQALVLRTVPNQRDKKSKNYSSTNPPYIDPEAIKFIIDRGVDHFLLDLPSVDKEDDGGALKSHHVFWEHPHKTNLKRTITEMIYVPDLVKDGLYLLNIQMAPFENDASPSKPVLYELL